MESRIRTAILEKIGRASNRDRKAYRLAEKYLKIEKQGRYYIATLFNNEVRIYCNTKYLFVSVYNLLCNNSLWLYAKHPSLIPERM